MAYKGTTSTSPFPPRKLTQAITGPQVWIYQSTQLRSDIIAANYFTDGQLLGMRPGDWLFHSFASSMPFSTTGIQSTGDFSVHNVEVVGSTTTEISKGVVVSDAAPPPLENAIINGTFLVWQRGTSVNGLTAENAYTADRWEFRAGGTVVVDVDQELVTLPDGEQVQALSVDVTTADVSIAAGAFVQMNQIVEGINITNYGFGTSDAQEFTISFWVYATVTGIYCLSLENSAQDRSYIAEYTIHAADTWEKKSISITADVSGTWLTTNGIGVKVRFPIALGSDFHGVTGWQAGALGATSNQVNGVSDAANFFKLAEVSMNLGAEQRMIRPDMASVFAQCQRYYQRTDQIANAPLMTGMCRDTDDARFTQLIPEMRTTPTLDIDAAGSYEVIHSASAVAVDTLTITIASPGSVQLNANVSGTPLTAGQGVYLAFDAGSGGHFALDAEMTN